MKANKDKLETEHNAIIFKLQIENHTHRLIQQCQLEKLK